MNYNKQWIVTYIDSGVVFQGRVEAFDIATAMSALFSLPNCGTYNVIKLEQVNQAS